MPKRNGKFTAKEKRFCEEYVIDFNGTAAMERAGYRYATKNVLAVTAHHLLRKPNVKAYINELVDERKKVCNIDAKYVVDRLKQIENTDFSEYIAMGKEGVTKAQLDKIPKYVRTMIQDITCIVEQIGRKKRAVYKFKMMSKDKALKYLGKHTQAITDNVRGKHEVRVSTVSDLMEGLDGE